MTATIIGGGIGGLTAAIALQRAGIEAHVYERARSLREIGAGISLWANALHALDELGVGNSIRTRLLSQPNTDLRTWRGAILSAPKLEDGAGGVSVGVLHRADLLSILTREVDRERVHLDHECTGFTQDGKGVEAQFANGESVSGDLLIGADGLRSVVRAQLFGVARPRYAGYTAWRAVVTFRESPLVPCESWSRGRRFGVVPMNDGLVYWFATKNATEGERDAEGHVKQHLLRLFRGWHNSIEALIEATDESAILRNDIYDRDPLASWTEGRVTLLGDAAHPMTPNLGQGACQAIEDAAVLAACLGTSAGIESGLVQYQDRRIPRTSNVVLTSRRIGAMAQWENPFMCAMRDLAFRTMPASLTERQLKSVVSYQALTERERTFFATP